MSMKVTRFATFFIALFAALTLSASTPTVTLYPPLDPTTKKYDEGRSCFSFKLGLLKEVTKDNNDWDIGYGFVAIDNQGWFRLHFAAENRSAIKDLGSHNWDEPVSVPVLAPRPPLEKGKEEHIAIDASADTHKTWAKNTQIFAKVVLGHMYLIHVKDDTTDFYVMFRVEEFEQHKYCKISWRPIPAPTGQRLQVGQH